MKDFSRILFNNQAIIHYRKLHWVWTLIIFFFAVFLVSVPFYVGRFTQGFDELTAPFPHYSKNFVELIEHADCEIIDATFVCDTPNQIIELPNYTAYLLMDHEVTDTDHAMIFNETTFLLSIDDEKGLGGRYQLGDVSFVEIRGLIASGELDGDRWANVFLRSVDLSRMSQDMVIIYFGMVIQYGFYLGIIALLMLFINAKQASVHFKFSDIFTILTLSTVSPALLMAFLSLFAAPIASVAFPLILVTRIVIVYMAMVRTQNG